MPAQKQIISCIPNRTEFHKLLAVNPGLIVIKLGATWCGPCKRIAKSVEGFFATSPPDVLCADLDVDECVDLYSYFKTNRIVNGIPVILCYAKGNVTPRPNDSITGSDPTQLAAFFKRCGDAFARIQYQTEVAKKIQGDAEKKELGN